MARYKKAGTCKRLVVTGCLSQRYPDELAAEMPEVDHFLGHRRGRRHRQGHPRHAERLARRRHPRLPLRRRHAAPPLAWRRTRAYVKIAEGCDRPCSFCIIPKLRGPQRSARPSRSCARRASWSARRHARDQPGRAGPDHLRHAICRPRRRPQLASLLRAAGAPSTGLRWIRLHYAYPTAHRRAARRHRRASRGSPSTSTCRSSTSTTAC